tara:strand:+ start:1268 stop:1570 length:303 start_codon:yes stop_codon:yes gene_type:complete
MSYTVASFLREKVYNMAAWLESEGMPRYRSPWPDLPDIALTAFAQTLRETYTEAIEARDFDAVEGGVPKEVQEWFNWVRERPALHDKFWRYLALFSETVK